MIYFGQHKEYFFIQTANDNCDFIRFIDEYSSFLIGKSVAIISWDSDSMKPSEEEYQRGWEYDENEVAYFDKLTAQELKTNIFANNYDEWYLFDEQQDLYQYNSFVNYSGFRLINKNEDSDMNDLILKFWNQIEHNKPANFILYGDNFIYGSKHKEEINDIYEAWK